MSVEVLKWLSVVVCLIAAIGIFGEKDTGNKLVYVLTFGVAAGILLYI